MTLFNTRHLPSEPRFDPLQLILNANRSWRDGGFTLYPDGSPYSPKGYGYYAVAVEGTECRFPGPPSATDVCFYLAINAAFLELRGHFLGGWVNNGRHYLDVSTVIHGYDAAVAESLRQRQAAFHDLYTGEDVLLDSERIPIDLPY